jgi:hypothetical protein
LIIELIGTWLLVGFVSAIGWNVADETVNKPVLDPWLSKQVNGKTVKVDPNTNSQPPTEQSK